ncbi:MAG: T9SS type A sorting domain-containing protein [Flavobacteriales bacterium]|nr:T9SS type A sorting domain-containing protein [Flavobacteriales bacterium]
MKNFHFISLVFFSLFANSFFAQEMERPLSMNVEQAIRFEKEKSFSNINRGGGGSISLPFFDDFSRYSLPTIDPEIPVEWQRWEDADVYINGTFPVSPPTIGVATFDGLAGNGYPYQFNPPDAYGAADSLTSLPINLGGLGAEDSVRIMFFYEPGGLGNSPNAEDSLVLEFYSPFGAGQWMRKWSAAGSADIAFQNIIIPITEPEFLLDGFKIRFRNYATLSCNCDHWHIDFVLIESNFSYTECVVDELAMEYPNNTLLDEYTAMPWTHFLTDPASFMADNFIAYERNLGPTENIVTGYRIELHDEDDDLVWDFPNQDINPANNFCSEIQRTVELDGFVYDDSVNDTTAVFDVSVYAITTDATPQNDTARFKQVFNNYYAYDDGSVERAYSVNVAGGKVAMKFFAETPDTLLGVFMHWIPFQNDNSNETFLLRIWANSGGEPGDELIENFTFHSPNYYQDGYNIFSYYEYDDPVPMNGAFYVGWVQDSDVQLNIGNDKNTNRNPTNLFYQLGAGAQWAQSTVTGSVMIRPVFKSGMTGVWNNAEESEDFVLNVFPNPVTDVLNIALTQNNCVVEVMDMSGRLLMKQALKQGVNRLDVTTLAPSLYTLRITDKAANIIVKKFIRE